MREANNIKHGMLELLPPLLIVVTSFSAFYVTAPGGFLSDDFNFLHGAMTLNASNFLDRIIIPDASWGFYRPIGLLYWWLCYKLFGMNAFGYWGLSILLHELNGYLIFMLLRRLKLGYQGALAGALIFIAFPLHGETVAWMSCAFERLCLMFMLAGAYVYTLYREGGRPLYYGLTLASFVFAILSKEMAVTFPALVFMVDVLMGDKGISDVKGAVFRTLPLAAAAACYLAVRFVVFHGLGGYTNAAGEPIQTVFDTDVIIYNLVHIPKILLFPVNALLRYIGVVYVLIAVVITIAVIERATSCEPPYRHLIIGTAWLAVAFIPAMTVYAVLPDLQGSRFFYIPSVGIAIVAGAIFGRTPSLAWKRNIVRLCLLAVTVGCNVYVSNVNYSFWPDAYKIAEFLPREVVRQAPKPPLGSDMYFIGEYDNIGGAFIYRNGLQQAINIEYGPGGGRRVKVHFIDSDGNAKDDTSVNYEALSKSNRDNLFIFNFKPKSGKLISVYPPKTAQVADKPDAGP